MCKEIQLLVIPIIVLAYWYILACSNLHGLRKRYLCINLEEISQGEFEQMGKQTQMLVIPNIVLINVALRLMFSIVCPGIMGS